MKQNITETLYFLHTVLTNCLNTNIRHFTEKLHALKHVKQYALQLHLLWHADLRSMKGCDNSQVIVHRLQVKCPRQTSWPVPGSELCMITTSAHFKHLQSKKTAKKKIPKFLWEVTWGLNFRFNYSPSPRFVDESERGKRAFPTDYQNKRDFIMQLKSSTIFLSLHQNLPKEIHIPEAGVLEPCYMCCWRQVKSFRNTQCLVSGFNFPWQLFS